MIKRRIMRNMCTLCMLCMSMAGTLIPVSPVYAEKLSAGHRIYDQTEGAAAFAGCKTVSRPHSVANDTKTSAGTGDGTGTGGGRYGVYSEDPEGMESYDAQDSRAEYDDGHHVSISGMEYLNDYFDAYGYKNLRIYMANYLYYFTGDRDAKYHASVLKGTVMPDLDFNGTVLFHMAIEEFPGVIVECEYAKRFRVFGFDSDIGDMSINTQLYIAECGYKISGKTLKQFSDGGMFAVRKGPRAISDKVYIGSALWKGKVHNVNKIFNIEVGADVPLTGQASYTKEEIRDMLYYLETKSGGQIRFTDCLPELWAFYESTHADIAAVLAIIITEGNYSIKSNAAYWNFFNYKTPMGGTSIPGKTFWNAKADSSTIGEAMVTCFQWIYRNYWQRGQDTYYLMAFNNYGYPRDATEAANAPALRHCYCPWMDDTGYVTTGYNDQYSWCNKCARNRTDILSVIGK